MSEVATKVDLNELGERLDKKFESGFERLDKKFESGFEDLTALLRIFMEQVDERFRRVEKEQRQIRADINRLFDYMDKIAKKQEISDQERLVMGHQLERLDRWTHELAHKIGYELNA